MYIDESFNSNSKRMDTKNKCNICEAEFESKDRFMKHRKTSHEVYVPACEKFAPEVMITAGTSIFLEKKLLQPKIKHHLLIRTLLETSSRFFRKLR